MTLPCRLRGNPYPCEPKRAVERYLQAMRRSPARADYQALQQLNTGDRGMTYAQACKALARARDERKRYQATMNTRDSEAWRQLRALKDIEITLQRQVRAIARH